MDYKFVFESFNEYVKANYSNINERDEDPGKEMSGTVALEILEKLNEYNLDLLDNYMKSMKNGRQKTSLMEILPLLRDGEGGKAILKNFLSRTSTMDNEEKNAVEKVFDIKITEDERTRRNSRKAKMEQIAKSIDDMSKEDANKKAELLLKQPGKSKIDSSIKRPALWMILPDTDKNKLAEEFSKLAMKRGYNSEGPLLNVVEKEFKDQKKEDRYYMSSPGFKIDTEAEAIERPNETPPKEEKSFMISEENESEVFKPNATGSNGESDFQGDGYKEMLDNLGSIFERYMTGTIKSLKGINIYTSADRYRNTGDAESLSWGQLSYARALTMARAIEGLATKANLDDDLVAQLPKLIKIYSKGGNGDGTSGPNPPEGIKFGYYVKDGNGVKFVDGEDRKTVTMIAVDGEGTPTADSADGAKTKSMDPEANKDDYNQYRYNNIEIIFDVVDTDFSNIEQSEESVTNLIFPARVSIPSRYSKRSIRIPLPTITTSKSSKIGGNTNPTSCPSFKESSSTSFGFSFKPVTIARWETDLAD